MDKYEQQREEQRKRIEQQEKIRDEKNQAKMQNLKSFDEIYEEEFYKVLKDKKTSDGALWTEVFQQNFSLDSVPVDCVLKDNIKNDNQKIDQILQDEFCDKIKKYKNCKIEVEPFYINAFVYSYDAALSYVVSVAKLKSRHGFFSSNTWCEKIKSSKENQVANLDKYTSSLQINSETNNHTKTSDLKIQKIKKSAGVLFKQIKKEIIDDSNKYKNVNSFFSSIIFYDLQIQRILVPAYKVKYSKFLKSTTFLIDANSLEIIL